MTTFAPPLAATVPFGVDPTKVQLAYGARAIPKLVSELRVKDAERVPRGDIKTSGSTQQDIGLQESQGVIAEIDNSNLDADGLSPLFVQQRALVFLSGLLRDPENIAQALKADFVPKLSKLVIAGDVTVRQKSTEILVHFAAHSVGRTAIVEKNLLPILASLFDDPDTLVRTNVHEIFVRVTSQKNCVLSLALEQEKLRPLPQPSVLDTSSGAEIPPAPDTGFIPVLVSKVSHETPDIQCLALTTLYNLIRFSQGFAVEALQMHAMTIFTKLIKLQSAPTSIKYSTAKAIMSLSFYPEGKRLACTEGTIPVLLNLLDDRSSDVRATAAGALMGITVDIEAKRLMARDKSYQPLIDLLDDESDWVKLNVIKTIANCSEDYRGRFAFQNCIERLEEFNGCGNEHLQEAARRCVEVITWRP